MPTAHDIAQSQQLPDANRPTGMIPVTGPPGSGDWYHLLADLFTLSAEVVGHELIVSQGTGANIREAFRVDIGSAPPPPRGTANYGVWTATGALPTEAQVLAGDTSDTDSITVRAVPPAAIDANGKTWLWIVTTRDSLADIYRDGDALTGGGFTTGAPTPITVNGQQYYGYRSIDDTGLAARRYGAPSEWEEQV